ncbi:MAG: metal ABC transporter solute-binding protein, Zn/Mn family [Nitrospinota bacterium]
MLRRLTPVLIALVAVTVALPSAAKAGAKLRIVATFSILGDFVRNVGGDKVKLHTLVGPDGDPHNYEPNPLDSVALVKAGVVFENGLGFEAWLDDLYRTSRSKAKRVAVTHGLRPIYREPRRLGRKEADPHMWLDADRAAHMVRGVRDALISADPANAGLFGTNAMRYIAELRALDTWIFKQVRGVPEANRILVTSHQTFGYFAARYGFQVLGSALDSLTTEASEPPAGRIAALMKEMKSASVRAVFPETLHSPRWMERLAAETGANLAPSLYTGALGKRGSPAGTYVQMMKHNVQTIVNALRP